MTWTTSGESAPPRILILGGGFAGTYAAFDLQRQLRGIPAEIAIVNRENFFVFYPLIPEIVSGTIETEHILTPIRMLAHQATLYVGEVTGIDLDERRVDILHGLYGHRQRPRALYYDHLVLALGGVPNTRFVPGLAEHAFDIQRLPRAFALRNHLIDILEQADIETNPDLKRQLLTVVVVGGGANGVEVMAEIRDLLCEAAEHYPHIEPEDFRLVLVQAVDRLIPELPEKLGDFAERLLRERGVEVILNQPVTAVEPNRVVLKDGTVIDTETIIGSVGVDPNPLTKDLPLEHDRRGRLITNQYLGIDGAPNVWAIGDNASVTDPNTGEPYPQTAQHAVREASVVAHNIAATLKGKALKPINYRSRGQLVALGHRSAVAQIYGRTFSGFPAWWAYRTYYLAQLPRWEKRLRVTFDWTLDLVFPPTLVQLKVGQSTPTAARRQQQPAPAPGDGGGA